MMARSAHRESRTREHPVGYAPLGTRRRRIAQANSRIAISPRRGVGAGLADAIPDTDEWWAGGAPVISETRALEDKGGLNPTQQNVGEWWVKLGPVDIPCNAQPLLKTRYAE